MCLSAVWEFARARCRGVLVYTTQITLLLKTRDGSEV